MQIKSISDQSERIKPRNKKNERITQEIGQGLLASEVVLVNFLNSDIMESRSKPSGGKGKELLKDIDYQ